jgi:hypothetical protein
MCALGIGDPYGLIGSVRSLSVLGCGEVAQVVEGELVGRWIFDGDRGVDLEVTVDVK